MTTSPGWRDGRHNRDVRPGADESPDLYDLLGQKYATYTQYSLMNKHAA